MTGFTEAEARAALLAAALFLFGIGVLAGVHVAFRTRP